MSKVVAVMSMSLDGFVADADGGLAEVFGWNFSGDVEVDTGGADPMRLADISSPAPTTSGRCRPGLGAVLTGRRTFESADGWGGNHAWGPAFVLGPRGARRGGRDPARRCSSSRTA